MVNILSNIPYSSPLSPTISPFGNSKRSVHSRQHYVHACALFGQSHHRLYLGLSNLNVIVAKSKVAQEQLYLKA